MIESSHKCGGHCCKAFVFPFSPEELKRIQESIDNCTDRFVLDTGYAMHHQYPKKEVDNLVDMLIPLGLGYVNPQDGKEYGNVVKDNNKFPQLAFKVNEDGDLGCHTYTCKHLDVKEGLCTNYENRPLMCRIYPNSEHGCEYSKCEGSCRAKSKVETV